MPPARTITVNRPQMLASIARMAAGQREATLARITYWRDPQRQEALDAAQWVNRDVAGLAGRPLTASERKRHQEALREMAAAGLVYLHGQHVRLTPAGLTALEAQP